MEKSMNKKSVKVLDRPLTFILVDENVDEKEAKAKWLKKRDMADKSISEEQVRRETLTVRGGKVLYRSKFK